LKIAASGIDLRRARLAQPPLQECSERCGLSWAIAGNPLTVGAEARVRFFPS
jgi:hypothetical protein